jgi:hypothetical protein
MDRLTKDLINKILFESNDILPNFIGDNYPEFIRKTLESIYRKMAPRHWGKINTETCQTGFGVLNVFEHPDEVGGWSILNRFDTNTKVKNKIQEIYDSENTDENFQTWIWKHKNDLFGPDGEYTQSLVDINKQTILSGAKREESAIQMLNNRFGEGTIIKRFCSGDKRDTLKGQDLLVETPKGTFTVQVKPYGTIKKFIDDEGSIYYEVNARGHNSTKYSPKNVQTIMFVHDDKFIVFSNSRSKIGNVSDGVTRFYEEPLYTNMVFDKENKKNRSTTTRMVKDVFNYGDKESEIQRLELKKAAIDRLISKIQNNL